jgi:hypothetical protein
MRSAKHEENIYFKETINFGMGREKANSHMEAHKTWPTSFQQ